VSRFSSNAQGPALPECLIDRVDHRLASSLGAGWWSLLEEMHTRLDAIEPRYRLSQVKEKLGVLRVYLADTSYERSLEVAADLKEVVSEYERRSAEICEHCGGVGQLIELPPGRTLATLCDRCAASQRGAFAS
jgi:hypothetical protein